MRSDRYMKITIGPFKFNPMAEYNLKKNHKDRQKAIDRFKKLLDEEAFVDLTKRVPRRSLDQNGWLHLLFTFFAIDYGMTMEESKTFLKRECPFMTYKKIMKENGASVFFLKQTSRLDKKECSEFIEWIYTYSGQKGINLPDKEDYLANKEAYQKLIRSHRQYL